MPSVISPLTASHPPRANTPTWPNAGITWSSDEYFAWRRTFRTRAVEAAGRVGERRQLTVLLAEALDDSHAGDGLVDHAGHLARDAANPTARIHLAAQLERHHEQRRHREQA